MMFLGMALMLPAIWFLPWWAMAFIALWIGWISGPSSRNAVNLASSAGLVWAALAFLKDGQNLGLISRRMAGLFSLPHSSLIFLVIFVIGFVTACLCFQAGAALSTLYKVKTVSANSRVS